MVRGDDDLWHLYYTGTRKAEEGLPQRLGHATSTDLHNWARVGDGFMPRPGRARTRIITRPTFAKGVWHDRAMRDPWVMRDPDGDGWLMYFTARVSGVAEPNAGGLHRLCDLARRLCVDTCSRRSLRAASGSWKCRRCLR